MKARVIYLEGSLIMKQAAYEARIAKLQNENDKLLENNKTLQATFEKVNPLTEEVQKLLRKLG